MNVVPQACRIMYPAWLRLLSGRYHYPKQEQPLEGLCLRQETEFCVRSPAIASFQGRLGQQHLHVQVLPVHTASPSVTPGRQDLIALNPFSCKNVPSNHSGISPPHSGGTPGASFFILSLQGPEASPAQTDLLFLDLTTQFLLFNHLLP